MKRITTLIIYFLFPTSFSLAQSITGSSATPMWDDPMALFYVTVGFLFVVALLVLLVATYMLQVLNILAKKETQTRAEKMGIQYKEEPSLWTKFNEWVTRAVPVEKEATIILDHNYDGIRGWIITSHHGGSGSFISRWASR